jgi:uncharacterized membrane protein YkvA (DUF1232 family)
MIFKVGRLLKAANTVRLTAYLIALWKLFKHPQTPRHAKMMAVLVLAYALSPIDLIPDFIPVLGQLDDVILVPLGIALVVRMTPRPLWEQLLREAEASSERLPALRWGIVIIAVIWLLALALLVWGVAKLAGA